MTSVMDLLVEVMNLLEFKQATEFVTKVYSRRRKVLIELFQITCLAFIICGLLINPIYFFVGIISVLFAFSRTSFRKSLKTPKGPFDGVKENCESCKGPELLDRYNKFSVGLFTDERMVFMIVFGFQFILILTDIIIK